MRTLRVISISAVVVIIHLMMAPVVEAKVGYLYLDSDPPGARAVIEDIHDRTIVTPALCTLLVGDYRVTIHQTYYRPETTYVHIESDRVLRKRITLEPFDASEAIGAGQITMDRGVGDLTILTDVAGGIVYIDDDKMDVPTPVTLKDIAAGEHRLRIDLRGLVFDTTMTVQMHRTTVLHIAMADLVAASGKPPGGDRVPVSLIVDIPRCRYRRADKRTDLQSNITLRGVDPKVRVIVGDSTVEFSHRNLATHDITRDRSGEVIEKATPDTTCRYELVTAWNQVIEVAVVTYSYTGGRLIARDRLKPVSKTCRIAGDFNSGQPINIRITIDADGDIIFKYW